MSKSSTVKWNNIIFALFVAETNVCYILNLFISIPFISVFLTTILILLLLYINKGKFLICSSVILYYLFFIFAFVVSIIVNDVDYIVGYLSFFLVFAICAVLCVSVECEFKSIFKYLLVIYAFHLFTYFILGRNTFIESDTYSSAQMGVAYSLLPAVLISISSLFFYKEIIDNKYHFFLVLTVALLSGYVIIFDCLTRGVLVVVVLCCFLLFLRKLSKTKRIIAVLFFFIVSLFFVTQFEYLFNLFISNGGDNVRALSKLQLLIDKGDASNGRNDLYLRAIEIIKENPLWGHGIGYFESFFNGAYPHQFFLQLLVEYGLFSIFIISPFFIKLKKLFTKSTLYEYIFYITFFSFSVLSLTFSSAYWLSPYYWVCFFYTICSLNNCDRISFD